MSNDYGEYKDTSYKPLNQQLNESNCFILQIVYQQHCCPGYISWIYIKILLYKNSVLFIEQFVPMTLLKSTAIGNMHRLILVNKD